MSEDSKPEARDAVDEIDELRRIVLLDGQTTKQPTIFRCPNPECVPKKFDRVTGQPHRFFDFESDQPVCPKCGLGAPHVAKRALIHFLLRDPAGPIQGEMGLRYKIACDHKREVIATTDNGEAGTGDLAACNCAGCLRFVGTKIRNSGSAIK